MRRPTLRRRARADRELEVIVQRLEEADEKPADQPQPAPLPVEPADAPAVPNEMETLQIDEDNRAGENPPILVDSSHTRDPTCSDALTGDCSYAVLLERSQCTRDSLSNLQDFSCDLFDVYKIL